MVPNNGNSGVGFGNPCGTRKVVSSQCRTDEVEPGRFIRKCEKTERIFKSCAGRSNELVESNEEYTEEDVTDQMVKGSFTFNSSQPGFVYFPGLRNDIEAIERKFFGGMNQFFEAAEEIKNDFFNSVRIPRIIKGGNDVSPSSSHKKNRIPIETQPKEAFPKINSDGDSLFGKARDV